MSVGGGNEEPGSVQLLDSSEFYIMKLGLYSRDGREPSDDFISQSDSFLGPLSFFRTCPLYAYFMESPALLKRHRLLNPFHPRD